MLRKNFPVRKKSRKEFSNERKAEREKRSPQEQFERLDAILGEGVGAKKERARLVALIEGNKE